MSCNECLHHRAPSCDPLPSARASLVEPAHVDEMAGDRGRRRHRRAHQVRASAGALPALRNCGSTSTRSARPAPAGRRSSRGTSSSPARAIRSPRRGRSRSRPSRSACALTSPEPGTTIASFTLPATWRPRDDGRGFAQVLDARVRARADEHLVDADVGDRRVGRRAPCTSSARSMPSRRSASRSRSGSGTRSSIDTTISGDVPQVTCGRIVGGVERRASCRTSRPDRSRACASARPRAPTCRPPARTDGPSGSRSSCRRRRPCRRARRPRSPCCTPSSGLPSTARASPRRRTRSRSRCRPRCRSGR